MAAILENRYTQRYVTDRLIRIKFGKPVQNHMPMAVEESKQGAEFQHGGRLFSKRGSSSISLMD